MYEKGYVLTYGVRGGYKPDYQQYNNTLSTTIEELVREAALGNWTRANFQTRVANVTGTNEKIYTLVQCSPDLSAMNCSACLNSVYSYIPRCCYHAPGGHVIHANCMLKYSNQSFFGGDADAHHSGAHRGLILSCFHIFYLVVFLSMYFIQI